uniref:Uncharacterized protein n=1 Tax=Arundo donax TaxID=35708 RepID=A0A0A9C9G8_ARUDO
MTHTSAGCRLWRCMPLNYQSADRRTSKRKTRYHTAENCNSGQHAYPMLAC